VIFAYFASVPHHEDETSLALCILIPQTFLYIPNSNIILKICNRN